MAFLIVPLFLVDGWFIYAVPGMRGPVGSVDGDTRHQHTAVLCRINRASSSLSDPVAGVYLLLLSGSIHVQKHQRRAMVQALLL